MKAEGHTAAVSMRMPDELRDRLAQAATEGGRSLGEEIRRRLEASLGAPPPIADAKTTEFLRCIAFAAGYVGKHCGPWHQNPYAHAVLRTIVAELLAKDQPPGEPEAPSTAGAAFEGPPEQAGRVLASIIDLL